MVNITLSPGFSRDLDGLRTSERKIHQKVSEVLLELMRGNDPSVPRRPETRIPKCEKFEITDDYRLVAQRTDDGGLVALTVGKHTHVDSYLDGHKGFIFDKKTGKLKELRLATIAESQVDMVPSVDLMTEKETPDDIEPFLFENFTTEMLEHLGVPTAFVAEIQAIRDPNALDCMMTLQALADVAGPAADALLAYATGDSAQKQVVIGLSKGQSVLLETLPAATPATRLASSEEFITFSDPDELDHILRKCTLKQWQLFLHPSQRTLVEREFSGPARLRGISGSGKTVVALHRARRLAKRAFQKGEKVLFTTFDKGLATAASQLLDELCGPEREAIEVTHLHRWCLDYLSFRGMAQPRYSPDHSRQAREKAFSLLPDKEKTAIKSIPPEYLSSEIDFLMGRFPHEEAEMYLTTDRGGRGRSLTIEQRRAVLELYRLNRLNLAGMGFVEPAEFVRFALSEISSGCQTKHTYSSVIVDEVQDISEIALMLLHRIVGDRTDGLLLVGDTTQRIFTRGYSLKGLGIDISGRGVVLKKNYRNTRQILESAFPLVENEWREDLALSGISAFDANPEFSVREGCRPIIVRCNDEDAESRFLTSEIRALLRYNHYRPEDIAVLARNKYYREMAAKALRQAGILVHAFRDQEAGEVQLAEGAVRVSSLHGAKGHEFGTVFVVGFVDGIIPLGSNPENLGQEAAVLYVGMTRARDLLYLSYSLQARNHRALRRSQFCDLLRRSCDEAIFRR